MKVSRKVLIAASGSVACALALAASVVSASGPTTYGPFYASSVVSAPYVDGGGGVVWTNPSAAVGAPDGVKATNTIGNEQVTEYLKATGFNANIPTGKTIQEVVFEYVKTDPGGFNDSDYLVIPAMDYPSNYGGGTFAWDNTEHAVTLTPSDVNASNFGMVWAGYNMGTPGQISVDSVRMTVITD